MSVSEDKKACRQLVRERLNGMLAEDRARYSAAASAGLVGLDVFSVAESILFYWPLGDEADPRDAIKVALQTQKKVFLPCVEGFLIRPIQLNSLDVPMEQDELGVQTPIDKVFGDPEQLSLVIVPAVAFDLEGGRLGRGGGYYDRFLGTLPASVMALGFGFEAQVVDQVVQEPHDVSLGGLVTDCRAGVIDRS